MAKDTSQLAYSVQTGTTQVVSPYFDSRDPTTQDVNFPLGKIWIRQITPDLSKVFILTNFFLSAGVIQANWEFIGGSSGDIQKIMPDSGADVIPDATSTVVITGFPVGVSNLKNIKTFNGGAPGNILQLQDLGNLSRYVVGKSANEAVFTSIQAAINAAVADGASSTSHQVVLIQAGIYTENITMAPFVSLIGSNLAGEASCVEIIGTVSLTNAVASDVIIDGIKFTTTGGNPGLLINPTATTHLTLNQCAFFSSNGTAFSCTSTDATVRGYGLFFQAISGQKNFNISNGFVTAYNCTSEFVDTPSTISGGNIGLISCSFGDSLSISGNGGANLISTVFNSSSFPCLSLSGSANLTNLNSFLIANNANAIVATGSVACSLIGGLVVCGTASCFDIGAGCSVYTQSIIAVSNAASGFYATGTGDYLSQAVTPAGSAQAVNPTLNLLHLTLTMGNISFDGGATKVATNGQLIIGNTVTGFPSINTITAGTGATITNGPGTITISISGGGLSWSDKTTNFAAASNNGYFIAGNAIATLPAAPSNGDAIAFIVDGAFTVTVTANTGQTIKVGPATSAASGTAANTANGDTLTLVYRSTNTRWEAESFIGAWVVT